MAGKNLTGQYSAQAVLGVTESAANTLTFAKLETGMSVYDKIGWVVNRLEWRLGTTALAQFNTSGDIITAALTMSNALTALSDTDPAIIAIRRWQRLDLGTAASGAVVPLIFVDDFSTLPGGGILILPNPIYSAIQGSGMAAATGISIRMFYTAIEMGQDDYVNLVQGRQLLINS